MLHFEKRDLACVHLGDWLLWIQIVNHSREDWLDLIGWGLRVALRSLRVVPFPHEHTNLVIIIHKLIIFISDHEPRGRWWAPIFLSSQTKQSTWYQHKNVLGHYVRSVSTRLQRLCATILWYFWLLSHRSCSYVTWFQSAFVQPGWGSSFVNWGIYINTFVHFRPSYSLWQSLSGSDISLDMNSGKIALQKGVYRVTGTL